VSVPPAFQKSVLDKLPVLFLHFQAKSLPVLAKLLDLCEASGDHFHVIEAVFLQLEGKTAVKLFYKALELTLLASKFSAKPHSALQEISVFFNVIFHLVNTFRIISQKPNLELC
jgi:hypothetical protein